jgi:peptidoglycan/LPS O-acetylase OafA/YrhL
MTTPEGPSDAALPRIWIKPYYASGASVVVARAGLHFVGTLLIAQLSFHFFEAPLLRLKRVLAPQAAVHGSSPVAPAHLHVSEPRG